jgi:hypothetical protein
MSDVALEDSLLIGIVPTGNGQFDIVSKKTANTSHDLAESGTILTTLPTLQQAKEQVIVFVETHNRCRNRHCVAIARF